MQQTILARAYICCFPSTSPGAEAVVDSEAVKRWIQSSFSSISGVRNVAVESRSRRGAE
eukprot:jgi/Bigna1/60499/fgenesh1_kg.12_\